MKEDEEYYKEKICAVINSISDCNVLQYICIFVVGVAKQIGIEI